MTPLTVNSIPWMPERAWTVARANCAIAGLTRSDYSPENVQPNPPCEGEDTDPNPPYLIDCLPRYVPWREMPRTPDFDGGEGTIEWQRSLGWGFPDTCVPVPQYSVIVEVQCQGNGIADCAVQIALDGVPWQTGVSDINGFVNFGPAPPGAVMATQTDAQTQSVTCGGGTATGGTSNVPIEANADTNIVVIVIGE